MPRIAVGDHALEVAWHGPGASEAPTLVFLHEGLGSLRGWRDIPARLAEATGHGALVASRRGYGASDPLARPFPASFLEDEARGDLPALLAAKGIAAPILVGHSDGASIALVAAAETPAPSPAAPAALVLLAPHVFVEEKTVARIAALRERAARDPALVESFRRQHGTNTEALLDAWTAVWLSAEFRRWDIRDRLAKVTCPVLVIQGEDDEYGTLAQVSAIADRTAGPLETLVLPRCGHAPHRDHPDAVLDAIARWLRRLPAARDDEPHGTPGAPPG